MVAVAPIKETHDLFKSTCSCKPDVEMINGDFLITHKLYDQELETEWGVYKKHKQPKRLQ
jgi:hypothetical protein